PETVIVGNTITLTAQIKDVNVVASATINLMPILNNANQPMFDDGTNGDEIANDGIYTYKTTIPNSVLCGVKNLVITATDIVSNISKGTITLQVTNPKITTTIPTSGTIGTIVTIAGEGYLPEEQIRIDFGTTKSITIIASDNTDNFTGTFSVDFQSSGLKTITVTGVMSCKSVEVTFRVDSCTMLLWLNEPGYKDDGLYPEIGLNYTTFTYKVMYFDSDNDAPLGGYPVVHIFKGATEVANSPFVMEEVDSTDINYVDGKWYTYSTLLPEIGTYSYYFEAYDAGNVNAVGQPVLPKERPIVTDKPVLMWAAEEGFIHDGINPGTGTRYVTNFTYKVTYQDPTGYPPATGYPRVHIFRGGNPEYPNGQYMFIKVGDDYKTGVTYTFATTFPIGGNHYTYYFEAKNTKGMFASGEPTNEQNGPIVEGPNFKPTLFWSQKQGFISDGIDPNFGTLKTDFTYQILYQDTNGDPPAIGYPIVYIYKQANLIATATMNFVDGNWAKGANYAYSTTLPQKGEYQYQFKVRDEQGEEVTFPPYLYKLGPEVITIQPKITDTIPSSGNIGTIVTVIGEGYLANEQIQIDFGATLTIGLTTTNAQGSFTAAFTVDSQPYGLKTITATGLISCGVAKSIFT
ncbi:MAG: choice-of-anchor X domain-containing protein, partial [bacterium]